MAKVVKIDGAVLGFPEKNWKLIDSNTNVKKFIRNFTEWNDNLLELDENPISLMNFIDKYIGWKPVTLVMGGKPRSRT